MAEILFLVGDPVVEMRVHRALAPCGHVERPFDSLEAARQYVRKEEHALVLVHRGGPPEACASLLRDAGRETGGKPLILLAPGRRQAYVDAADAAGAFECLLQPWGNASIRMAVKRALAVAGKHELEERLAKSQRMAVLGTLAAKVAHELNNPLDGIARFINLTMAKTPVDHPTRSYLEHSRDGLKRMNRVVGSILEFSRMAPTMSEPTPIDKLVARVIASLEGPAEEKRARIVTDIDPRLPRTTNGDLYSVFRNLIKNALDAVGEGGTVTVTARPLGRGAVVTVADDGCGMPEAVRRLVFEPFYTTKEPGKGTGLGMAICKDIVTGASGAITVDSEEGKGTTVTVALPGL